VVVISVDQCSAELMQTYASELTGGLARLCREGVSFTEAYQDHGFTETGPGHSVILSGRFPTHTGIIQNAWLDRPAAKFVYCVEDPAARPLIGQSPSGAVSQAHFQGDALGDWLQRALPGSRVFAVAGKDRAAILMAGRRPTGVYWFSGAAGFNSSTAYEAQPPAWLIRFNQGLTERFATRSWLWTKDPGTPEGRHAQWTFGETLIRNGALPRLIQGASMPLGPAFATRFSRSPFLDEVTQEAAEALMSAEHLGQGPSTDLLAVSFSATDYIGHAYGNRGTEMRDQIHRLDRTLDTFLAAVKRQDPGAWVVLTADHGGMDVVEALAAEGFPAHRVAAGPFVAALNEALRKRLALSIDLWRPTPEPTMLYLDEPALRACGQPRARIIQESLAWVRSQPLVALALSAEELARVDPAIHGSPRDSSLPVLLRRSFLAERSGDLLVAFQPLTLFDGPPAGYPAGHGSPYGYDRRVPLIFWGPWKGGVQSQPVRVVDLAPTLAQELDIQTGPVDGHSLSLPR
jgi:predicted AlkP superfamily pyrophosphatase or phosphodiesterase